MLNYLSDGGPLWMYSILIILLINVVLLAKVLRNRNENQSNRLKIANYLAAFAVAWGFTGQLLGISDAMYAIELAGDISPQIAAAGFRISFYAPLFGLLTFLITKLGSAIYYGLKK